jgi:hypothetical protein
MMRKHTVRRTRNEHETVKENNNDKIKSNKLRGRRSMNTK